MFIVVRIDFRSSIHTRRCFTGVPGEDVVGRDGFSGWLMLDLSWLVRGVFIFRSISISTLGTIVIVTDEATAKRGDRIRRRSLLVRFRRCGLEAKDRARRNCWLERWLTSLMMEFEATVLDKPAVWEESKAEGCSKTELGWADPVELDSFDKSINGK